MEGHAPSWPQDANGREGAWRSRHLTITNPTREFPRRTPNPPAGSPVLCGPDSYARTPISRRSSRWSAVACPRTTSATRAALTIAATVARCGISRTGPTCPRREDRRAQRAKQMHMVGHQHVSPDPPLRGFTPRLSQQNMHVPLRKNGFAALDAHGQVDDRGCVESFDRRKVRRPASLREIFHRAPCGRVHQRPRRSVALHISVRVVPQSFGSYSMINSAGLPDSRVR